MKKILTIVLSLALVFASAFTLSACSENADYTIAVIQYARVDALDQANESFCARLKEWAEANGKTISFEQANTGGSMDNVASAVNASLAKSPDIILGIATPVAVALAGATSTVPVLYTAVTDPADAKLTGRSNVFGTSDMQPVAAQIDLLKDLVPSAKKVAFLFSSEESNSRKQIDLAEAECDKLGLTYEEKTVTDVQSIRPTVTSISEDVDAVYIPTDNTIAANLGTVVSANSRNLPLIVGETGMLATGGWATLSLSYGELGKQTAEMAIKILTGKTSELEAHQIYKGAMSLDITDAAKTALGITAERLAELKQKYGG